MYNQNNSFPAPYIHVQGDSDQAGPSVPDDITAYYEKMDNDEEENDDQVHTVMCTAIYTLVILHNKSS